MDCYFSNFNQYQIGTYIGDKFVPEKCLVVENTNTGFTPLWIECPQQETIEYLESLWTTVGDQIINNFTGYKLRDIQNILYDIPSASGKSLLQVKLPEKIFSSMALDDEQVRNIIENYKITNEWLQLTYTRLVDSTESFADRILSKRAIFIIGNSGSGKSEIIKSPSVIDFFANLGVINPINIDYDTIVEETELFNRLKNACDSTAFKRVYEMLYSGSLINIEEELVNYATKLHAPLLFHMINFNHTRAQNLKDKGYDVHVLVYTNNKDLSRRRYANAKKGLVKDLKWLTKEEIVSSIDKNLSNSIYATDDGHIFEEIKKYNKKNIPLMQDITYMFNIKSDHNPYRFNNSIIQYKDNMYICAYRLCIGIEDVRNISGSTDYVPSYKYSNGLYPEMWAGLYNPITNSNDVGLHVKYSNGDYGLLANPNWNTKSYIALCLLNFKNNVFSLINGSETILNIEDSTEDPRLYRKSDGEIYMYYMSRNAIFDNNISDKLRPKYCSDKECYFVIESLVKVKDNGVPIIQSKHIFNSSDPEAPKVLCLQSQIDHAKGDILFDKNYAPYSWSGQDYFGYSITKMDTVYKRGVQSGSDIDCSLMEQSVMHMFFAKLFDYDHFVHSISQNTPAIQWGTDEYICVGHMRLQNSMLNFEKIKECPESMKNFYKQEYREYKGQKIFIHSNIYFMFFYTFNPAHPTKIKRISHCFIPNYNNRKFTLCFAMSLSFVENHHVCLTFGEGDVLCRSILMSRTSIEEILFDIDKADPDNYKFALMDVISNSNLVPDSTFTALDTIYSEHVGRTMGTIPLSIIVNKDVKPKIQDFLLACQQGNIKKVQELFMPEFLTEGLNTAVKYGQIDIVKFMLEKGAKNLNNSLTFACNDGNEKIAEILLDNGADPQSCKFPFQSIQWLWLLRYALHRGKKELIALINKNLPNWNTGLKYACEYGYKDLALFMIEKGAKDWNGGLERACYGGHMELALLMIQKGAKNWNEGLESACEQEHKELAQLMLKKGANIKYCSIDL